MDLHVRMMVRRLGDLADAIHECERLREVGEAELALERPIHLTPLFGQSDQPLRG
jgi:hypothetical protein